MVKENNKWTDRIVLQPTHVTDNNLNPRTTSISERIDEKAVEGVMKPIR